MAEEEWAPGGELTYEDLRPNRSYIVTGNHCDEDPHSYEIGEIVEMYPNMKSDTHTRWNSYTEENQVRTLFLTPGREYRAWWMFASEISEVPHESKNS